ncbi:MAG: nitrile hydratase subunit alpha [Pseudomonadota bacterium]
MSSHDHDHDHHHDHPVRADQAPTEYEYLENAVRELLVEKGLITPDEIRAAVEKMDRTSPERGAKLVAKAWADPSFMDFLMSDAPAAAEAMGMSLKANHLPADLVAVANRPGHHNLVVCTLCSCYPRMLLGVPPDWYKSRAYRSRAVREPRKVLAEFGTVLPEGTAVHVHDSNADLRYIVVPMRPEGTDNYSEDELAALVTRDTMIGVTVPQI